MNQSNNDSPKQFGLFSVIRGVDAATVEIKSTEIIIETIMPKGVCGIIAGTTWANKSFLAMQMGMSIANDADSFLGFEIKKKGLSYTVYNYIDRTLGIPLASVHPGFLLLSCSKVVFIKP